ncbi:Tetraspannin domain-containing protein [Cephalotus follicularis]|uniref:Tetraspannin domain-containing protein n=1 Tax=Cephalotus follicularis TaxID=3775 RepID=A0A1Q3BMZ6_CEPFO|nr:Tetraspannin domain-containing protein [Cephalotus follicularis]
MSFRISNNLVGILNFLTFLLSIPILAGGIWLSHNGKTECEKFLDTPLIILGVCLMVVSLAGLVGACCRVSWLLWFYLLVMFLLIIVVFCFTIFAFVVTNKGAGEVLSGKGYKEYKLGDYSDWLQKRVNNTKNWNKIKSCLIDAKVCSSFSDKYANDTLTEFYSENLSAIQSGCCKPSDSCGFTYVSPTDWTKTTTNSTNPDCSAWENDTNVLCFNCQSCKAGFLDNLKSDWKKVAIVNIVFLIFLVIVYSVGCCAFRNNRKDNAYSSGWKHT